MSWRLWSRKLAFISQTDCRTKRKMENSTYRETGGSNVTASNKSWCIISTRHKIVLLTKVAAADYVVRRICLRQVRFISQYVRARRIQYVPNFFFFFPISKRRKRKLIDIERNRKSLDYLNFDVCVCFITWTNILVEETTRERNCM